MPPTQSSVNPNDPQVIALSKAIFQHESGMKFNAVGDAGTSHGAGQWQEATWKGQAHDVLGDPNAPMTPDNQKAVIQGTIAQWKAQGLNPAQIAAKWNSGSPDGWENKVGTTTINGQQISYNVPKYVKSVTDLYQQYKGQTPSDQSGFNPKPFSNPGAVDFSGLAGNYDQSTSAPESFTGDLAQGNFGGALLKGAENVGNFLFPIVGDVANDVQGKSNKSVLQQGGDLALSALPFIPGLGEAGIAGKVLGEGAGLAAKGAAVGYGAGVASNLSQGQGIGQSLMPNANNLLGAATGGIAPSLIKGVGSLANKIAGIDPQIANELSKYGSEANPEDVGLYNKYIAATKQHSGDLTAKSPLTMAADNLDEAASKVQKQVEDAGAAVGEAKKAGANVSLASIEDVGQQFQQHVSDKYGLMLRTEPNTGKVVALPIPGSMRQIAPSDVKRITNIADQLDGLYTKDGVVNHQISTVKNASEVMDNLRDLVDHSKDDVYGHTNDPLDALIKDTAGNLNQVVRKSSPALADANDTFSVLKDLQKEIKTMAGGNLNRGELLMRRVFSGDKSGDVQDFFAKLKAATGVDLTKHAVLAKHAIETFGSSADKTLLEKMISGAADAHTGGLLNMGMNLATGAAKKTFANPEKIGRKLLQGGKSGILPSLITKGAIRGATSGLLGQ